MINFDIFTANMHLGRLLPEVLVLLVAMLAILTDVILPRGRSTRTVQWVSMIGLVIVIGVTFYTRSNLGRAFNGMVVVDAFTVYFRIILALITLLIISVSEKYIELARIRIAEYYLMLLFSLFGMMLMEMNILKLVL